jgi:hypothetical protein
MTTYEEFVTMVLAMREAQREDADLHTRKTQVEKEKLETRVDTWLQKYIAEIVQLDFWNRSVKGSEMPGVYDVNHDDDKEQTFET